MILTCPNCATQYAVKDGAIPPQGRTVRCASCKHSWHQDPEGSPVQVEPERSLPAEPFAQPAAEEPAAEDSGYRAYENVPGAADEDDNEDESLTEATLIEPRSGPEAEERAFEEAVLDEEGGAGLPRDGAGGDAAEDWREPPETEAISDDYVPFQEEDEIEAPRRRWLPFLLIFLLVAALSALFWFAAPDAWKARLGMAATSSPLALVTTHMDRQRLESGNELLTVTGRVINPTGQEQAIPPLSAELRTRAGKVVYRWTIAPPAASLAPGASASFNSAEVNVPPGGDELTITLGKAAS